MTGTGTGVWWNVLKGSVDETWDAWDHVHDSRGCSSRIVCKALRWYYRMVSSLILPHCPNAQLYRHTDSPARLTGVPVLVNHTQAKRFVSPKLMYSCPATGWHPDTHPQAPDCGYDTAEPGCVYRQYNSAKRHCPHQRIDCAKQCTRDNRALDSQRGKVSGVPEAALTKASSSPSFPYFSNQPVHLWH